MKKSRVILISGMLIAALGLTACGGTTTAPDSGANDEVGGTIQYAWWGGPARNDKTQAVIDLYQKKFPEVSVEGTTAEFGAYWEQTTVQAAGKNLPCVPQMQNRTLADYGDRGALRPLDDLIESGAIDVSQIPDSVLDSGRGTDGELYMIPYGAAFGALLVNATMVEEAGLSLPAEGYDWTWLQGWLKDIKAQTGVPGIDWARAQSDVLEAWLRSNGKDLYVDGKLGFDADDLAAFWDYTNGMMSDGTAVAAEQASEIGSLPLEQNPFTQGKQAALIWPANGFGTAQTTIDEVDPGHTLTLYPLPTGPAGYGNALWVSGLSISANCDNVGSAASFIDFFINDPEAATAFASDNGANVQIENMQRLIDDPATSDAKRVELELYKYVTDQDIAPTVYGKGYASIFQQNLQRFSQQVSFGQLTSEEAAKQFIEEANGIVG